MESDDSVPSVEPRRLRELARRTMVATVRQYSALASASRAAAATAALEAARTWPRPPRAALRVPSPRMSAAAPTPSSAPAATSSACGTVVRELRVCVLSRSMEKEIGCGVQMLAAMLGNSVKRTRRRHIA